MTWLLENPLPILIVGLLTIAILAGGWIQTGQRWLIYAALAAVGLTLVLLLVERWVVTDREHVQQTLSQLAADVERNDVDAVLGHIHWVATDVRAQVESEMPKYHFEQIKIARNLEITMYGDHQPPKAVAEFNVVATGSDRSGLIAGRQVVRFIRLTFFKQREQDQDHWRVGQFEHDVPNLPFIRR